MTRHYSSDDTEHDEVRAIEQSSQGLIAAHQANADATKRLNERLAYLQSLTVYALLGLFREGIRNLTLAQWKMELERQGSLHDDVNLIEQEVLRRLWKPQIMSVSERMERET